MRLLKAFLSFWLLAIVYAQSPDSNTGSVAGNTGTLNQGDPSAEVSPLPSGSGTGSGSGAPDSDSAESASSGGPSGKSTSTQLKVTSLLTCVEQRHLQCLHPQCLHLQCPLRWPVLQPHLAQLRHQPRREVLQI